MQKLNNSPALTVEKVLLDNAVHFLNGEIADDNILSAIKWVTYQNLKKRPSKILTLYVNSWGGALYQAFALIDIMNVSRIPIRTIGLGNVMSAGFLIFVSGAAGNRHIAANTGIMCHTHRDELDGSYCDLQQQLKEGDNCSQRMMAILKNATGLSASQVEESLLTSTDMYLTATQLVELGAADYILE